MATQPLQPRSRNDFKVAIICALPIEAEIVRGTLDLEWNRGFGKAEGDRNTYTFGRLGKHNVVLVHLPGTGNTDSGAVAGSLRMSFSNIRIAFIVGICGASPKNPSTKDDIVLGDCIVSTALVQYDYGGRYPGTFSPKSDVKNSISSRPNGEIRSFLAKLQTSQTLESLEKQLESYLNALWRKNPKLLSPGLELDRLFEATYHHTHHDPSGVCDECIQHTAICRKDCDELGCREEHLIKRERRISRIASNGVYLPKLHFGCYGSANTVLKSGTDRDELIAQHTQHNLIAFEMEGAGFWENFPTLIVKSACDYADSHKNKRWQIYAAATAAASFKAILDQLDIDDGPLDQLYINDGLLGPSSSYDIPFNWNGIPRAKVFINRPGQMFKLENALLPANLEDGDGRRIFVLRGLGGIGKTQLAVRFAQLHKAKFSAILWLNGDSETSLKRSIADYANRILAEHANSISSDQLSQTSRVYASSGEGDIDVVIGDVRKWLSLPQNNRWLMVFDNVDREFDATDPDSDSYDINKYIPSADHGSILITTRLLQLEKLGGSSEVRKVDSKTAKAILDSWHNVPEGDQGVDNLLARLDGLPLAIAQAGAYLNQTGTSIKTYLGDFDKQSNAVTEILHKSGKLLNDYANRSVWTTWNISYDAILAKNKQVANLLALWSFLDPNDFWYGLLETACARKISIAKALSDVLGDITTSATSFKEAMSLLRSYSMVGSETEESGYSIHAVVHKWILLRYGLESHSHIGWLALRLVGCAVPAVYEPKCKISRQRLLPHAVMCSNVAVRLEEYSTPNQGLMDMLSHQISVTDREDRYGAIDNLGILYSSSGRWQEAVLMHELALTWTEEYKSRLETCNNLGFLYKAQGKYDEAEKKFRQALEGYRKELSMQQASKLDTSTPNISTLDMGKLLDIVSNVGSICYLQCKFDEAEEMLLEAKNGYEELFGPKHQSTLEALNYLGRLYTDKDLHHEGEEMLNRAMEGLEERPGPKDESTFLVKYNLSISYWKQDKFDKSVMLATQAFEGFKEVLGPSDTNTLEAAHSLATMLLTLGKLDEAAEIYNRALKSYETTLGSDHPSTLICVGNLGRLAHDRGMLDEAEKMYSKSLKGLQATMQANNIKILETLNNIGLLLLETGKPDEAERMHKQVLEGCVETIGSQNIMTWRILCDLGNTYRKQCKLEEAASICTQALGGAEKAAGSKHTSTLEIANNLGLVYSDQNKVQKAEEMYRRALTGYEEILGIEGVKSYMPALKTMRNLGDLYSKIKRHEQSRMIYKRALAGYTIHRGPSSDICLDISQRLVALESVQQQKTQSEVSQEDIPKKEDKGLRKMMRRFRK